MANFNIRPRVTDWFLMTLRLLPAWVHPIHAQDDSCRYCGMSRAQFGHSWTIVTYADQTVEMVCSVHCAAIAIALHTDPPIERITVGDYGTHRQIAADTAFWVIGGGQNRRDERPGQIGHL